MDRLDDCLNGYAANKPYKPVSRFAFEPYGCSIQELPPEQEEKAMSRSGAFAEPPGPRKEYQDSVRVVYYRSTGESDEQISRRLKLPLAWVRSRGNAAADLPVPKQVPKYVAEYGTRCLNSAIEPFRPAELKRSFACTHRSAFDAIHASLSFEAAPALKRDYTTGKILDTGHRLLREKASCGLVLGVPSIDRAIAQIVKEYSIDDPSAYLLCNYYKDGRAFIAPHQHDFWSATFSFGESRVFLMDEIPLVLNHGDVLVFGSQRHSVPKMPNVKGKRISLSLFWSPQWRFEGNYTDEEIEKWALRNSEDEAWGSKRAEDVNMLAHLGISEGDAVVALIEANDDVDAAAEAVLTAQTGPSKKPSVGAAESESTQPVARGASQANGGKTACDSLPAAASCTVAAGVSSECDNPSSKNRGRWKCKRQELTVQT